MKKKSCTTVAVALLAIFMSSAQAELKIEVAEVQSGVAFIKGNGAALGSQITIDSRYSRVGPRYV